MDEQGDVHFAPYPYASRVITLNDHYHQVQENAALIGASSQRPSLSTSGGRGGGGGGLLLQDSRMQIKAARRQSMQMLEKAQLDSVHLVRASISVGGASAPLTSGSVGRGGLGLSLSTGDVPAIPKRRGTILDRIYTNSASSSSPSLSLGVGVTEAGGAGRLKGRIPSANKLLELHSKSMAGEHGGKALLHHHGHLPLPNSAMPAYVQRERWAEILGVSLHHRRLSSTRYYLIQMVGSDYIHQVNQVSLYMLFMIRRLYKRTIGLKKHASVVELTANHKIRAVIAKFHKGMKEGREDEAFKLQLAQAQQSTFMQAKVHHAFVKLRRLSRILSQESLFYSNLKIAIRSKPHILRAARLMYNRFMVWFMDVLKDIYYNAEITPEEIELSDSHCLKTAMRKGLRTWHAWQRQMSHQRVNHKNYGYHHHVLLRNRRLALYKRVLRRENRDMDVDWFSSDAYVLDDKEEEEEQSYDNSSIHGVSPLVVVKFLKRRATVQDVVDVTSRMGLYRAVRVLHQWARIRRLYYSHSDAIFSNYSVTSLPAHGPLSLSAPGRVRAIANDNIASIKLRHMPLQRLTGEPYTDTDDLSVLSSTSLAMCRERCAALPIPLLSYYPNPLVLEKVYSRRAVGAGTGIVQEGRVLTQQEKHVKSLQLQSLAPLREAFVVSFYPRSNTHKFRLRPFSVEEALAAPLPPPLEDTATEYKESSHGNRERSSIIAACESHDEDAQEGETIAGVATIRRGLVRARRKQQESHQSRFSSMLSKKLSPPSIIEGGTIEIEHPDHHYRDGHHDRHDGDTYADHRQLMVKRTKMSFLASGPISLAYLKHWLYQSRVNRRLKALSNTLRSHLDAKMMKGTWEAMRQYQSAQAKERMSLSKSGFARLARGAHIISAKRKDMKTAERHWKYVWMRRLFNNCAHLSFSTLSSARSYIAKVGQHRTVFGTLVHLI